MAAVRDVLPRAAALDAVTIYQGQPSAWLVKACKVVATGHAVVINVKGVQPDVVPVVLTLAEYERLRARGAGDDATQG